MIELTSSLIERFKEKAQLPPVPLQAIIKSAQNDAVEFAQLIIQEGYLDRDSAGELVAAELNRTYVNLSKSLFQQNIVSKLPLDAAQSHSAIPLYHFGDAITVGMVSPNDQKAVKELEGFLMTTVSPVFCFLDEIESAIKVNYQTSQTVDDLILDFDLKPFLSGQVSETQLAELVESKPLVKIADSIILLALKERASDIHIEPKKNEVVVRFRIDGSLVDKLFLPEEMALPLASRYKISAEMDITERRKPQDGRLNFELPMKTLDLRISSLPTLYGEKIVMRILGSLYTNAILNLDKLDISPEILRPLKSTLKQPQGILFVTGPTGSGKSTTLYAALNFISSPTINIVTIEDPVEYDIPTFNQVMVNDKIGRSFQAILRSVLRQDPDVVLVGEIRDTETARIATQAALTGHLVLTTLHTSDAIQATTRLLEMGVERFMVAPSIIGVLNQRLVKRLCEYCKVDIQPEEETLRQYFFWEKGAPLPRLYKGEGCERCGGTGYTGRIGIHEFLRITPQIREAIMAEKNYDDILRLSIQQGFHTIRYDGFKKALRGLTTIDEVVRASASETDFA
ncbi:MAG TPA: type II/IV secretion system protein [Betaproteobacteria bacterium]|nr:type II/IV secretion system protein [Betaproteobacteria bacterium]